MKRDIEFDALQKFWLTPPRVFDFETLRALKYSGDGGYLLELQKLYAGMFAEWDTLRKDVTTLMGAVAALDWRVVPYVEKGKKPDAKAQKVADVISRAIWARGKQKPGTYAHTFLQMVGAMAVDGLTRGVNVHELLLERLPDGTIAAPFYGHVFPNYYMWENRDRHDDRLMLVRDGMSFSDPEPFPENKFVIALNTQGSDHPMYNSVYASLLGYFGAAKWGLPWLQEYCRRYGHDIKKFTVQTDEQENRLREQLAQGDDPTEVFLRDGADMEVTPIPGAAGNPYEVLLKIAENHCHQAILGQTLTSDTGDSGGSRAQAEVHMGVQKDVVLHYAEYAAGVLNAQLIPALVELNFGKGDVPMPELQFSIPDGGVSTEVAQYWQAVLQIPGMRVAKEEVYESLRISMPADGADVFETPGAASAGEGSKQNAMQGGEGKPQSEDDDDDPEPPDNGGDKPKDGGDDDAGDVTAARGDSNAEDALMQQVDKMAAEGMRQWAAPVVEGLQKMLDAGVPMATIRDRLPELVPDTEALADALTDVFRLSLGVSEGDVAAANPYGCNQYGEGWREPHDGNSTSYQNTNPFSGEKKKVLTTEEGGRKTERTTDSKRVNKSDYDTTPDDRSTARTKARENMADKLREDLSKKLGKGMPKELQEMLSRRAAFNLDPNATFADMQDVSKGSPVAGGMPLQEALTSTIEELKKQEQEAKTAEEREAAKQYRDMLEKYLANVVKEEAKKKAAAEAKAKAEAEKVKAHKEAEDKVKELGKKYRRVPGYGFKTMLDDMHDAISKAELARRAAIGDDAYFNPKPEDCIPKKLVKQIANTPSLLNDTGKKEVEAEIGRREAIMKIDIGLLLGQNVPDGMGGTKHITGLLENDNERLLNFCEAGDRGSYYYKRRARSEAKLEGTVSTDRDGRNHPLCALLERSVGGAIHNFNSGSYGGIFLQFKPEVRERTTFTGVNSLGSDLHGVKTSSLITKPTEGQPFTRNQISLLNNGTSLRDIVVGNVGSSNYLEAQVRGILTARHIQSIGVPKKKVNGGWGGTKSYNSEAENDAKKLAAALEKVTGQKTAVKDGGNHFLVYFS